MRQAGSWTHETEDDWTAADRQTASLAGLAVALLLIVVGLFLVRQLHAHAALEECLLTGRPGCLATTGFPGQR